MASDDRIKVAVLVEAGGDERERDALTAKLRRELLRLNVDAVAAASTKRCVSGMPGGPGVPLDERGRVRVPRARFGVLARRADSGERELGQDRDLRI